MSIVVLLCGREGAHTFEEAAQDARMMDEHMSPGTTSNTEPGCKQHQVMRDLFTSWHVAESF